MLGLVISLGETGAGSGLDAVYNVELRLRAVPPGHSSAVISAESKERRDNWRTQKTPPRDANFLSQHLGAGGAELSPISPRSLLRQAAGESGVEIGRAVSASVAAPGIAPAPAPAGLRSSPAEPPRRSKSSSIPAGLVGGGGAGGGSSRLNHKQPGRGSRGSWEGVQAAQS